ncbi:MAG: type I-E CRISPR-associated protein Cas5/CasD [Puniceicoccaceae bacterium]
MALLACSLAGERALFRDVAVPGADVSAVELEPRTIKGLIGNILGLWRDFSNPEEMDHTPCLEAWWTKQAVAVEDIQLGYSHRQVLGQHRYKNLDQYMKPGESGPKPLDYLWDVRLDFRLSLREEGASELEAAWKQPVGLIYFGQSNCPAQLLPLRRLH